MEDAVEGEVPHRQHDIADRHGLLRKHLGDLAADHHPDDRIAGHVLGVVGADVAAVAEDRDLVGDLEELAHLVGDVDDAFAFRLERADDLEEVADLALGQGRGRLVHDEDVGIVGDRLGDLDHLAGGDAEPADLGVGIDFDVEALEEVDRLAAHDAMIDQAEAAHRLAPDPDVLGDRHVVHQVQFLMDHGDAVLERVERRAEPDLDAPQPEGAGVGRIDAGDDLHQRRLAGAVLAHEGVHRAALQSELDIVEREDAGEFLADVLDLEQVFGVRDGPALPYCLHRWWDSTCPVSPGRVP